MDSSQITDNTLLNVKDDNSNLLEIKTSIHDGEFTKRKRLKREVYKQGVALFTGIFFSFAAFKAVISLQSSINIQNAVGVVSGTILYLVALVWGLLVVPTMLRIYGAKTMAIVSEIGYCVYVLGNFYPVQWVMVIASFGGGIGEGTFWPACNLLCVHLADKYAEVMQKPKEKYISLLLGKFYLAAYATTCLGNLVSYAVINLSEHYFPSHGNGEFVSTSIESINSTAINYTLIEICGPNDCQSTTAIEENLDHYVPATKITVYILMAIFVVMLLVGMFVHYKILEYKPKDALSEKSKEAATASDNIKVTLSTLKQTCRQFVKPLQLTMLPLDFYVGLKLIFTVSEFGRAFVSCVVGVSKVGLAVSFYGVGGCFGAYATGKVSNNTRKYVTMFTFCAVDVAVYMVCLWVEFTPDKEWLCYLLSCAQGLTTGIGLTITSKLCTEYFPISQQNIAFSVLNIIVVVGAAMEFAVSTEICMSLKLWLHIAIVFLSALLFVIGELIHAHSNRKNLPQYISGEKDDNN